MAFFEDTKSALDFIIEARDNPKYTPRSLEFLDEGCLDILRPKAQGICLPKEARFVVYFEQECSSENERDELMCDWLELIEKYTKLSDDTQAAVNETQKNHIIELRHNVPETTNEESVEAVKTGGCKISTDWAVPYKRLHELFDYFDQIRGKLGDMHVVRFGHIGEGHPHFNFIPRTPEERKTAEEVDAMMAKKAVELGGVVTGEHGIGKLKVEHLSLQLSDSIIAAMKAIKREFDPACILAPGNLFK